MVDKLADVLGPPVVDGLEVVFGLTVVGRGGAVLGGFVVVVGGSEI